MTLILTVANSRGIYQSSDYQLTSPTTGAVASDLAGSKQLEASFEGLNLILAFTGVAIAGPVPAPRRTIDFLSTVLKTQPFDSNLRAICEALSRKSEESMRPYGRRGLLTLVLSVGSAGKPNVLRSWNLGRFNDEVGNIQVSIIDEGDHRYSMAVYPGNRHEAEENLKASIVAEQPQNTAAVVSRLFQYTVTCANYSDRPEVEEQIQSLKRLNTLLL